MLKPIPQNRIITKVNLHDYPTAALADRAGIDIVMIGDSIGMVVLGYENTIPVTMEEMIHHAKAVVREANTALLYAICLSCHEKRKKRIPYYLCPSLYLFLFSGS